MSGNKFEATELLVDSIFSVCSSTLQWWSVNYNNVFLRQSRSGSALPATSCAAGRRCSRGRSQHEAWLQAGHRQSYRCENSMSAHGVSCTCRDYKLQITVVTPAPSDLDKISIFSTCQIMSMEKVGNRAKDTKDHLKLNMNYT